MTHFFLRQMLAGTITCAVLAPALFGVAFAQEPLPRSMLIKLTRDQTGLICGSEVFRQCMGFDQRQCVAISERAIEKCLALLPDEITAATLQNSALASCPKKVYAAAGYSEERAQACFKKARAATAEQDSSTSDKK